MLYKNRVVSLTLLTSALATTSSLITGCGGCTTEAAAAVYIQLSHPDLATTNPTCEGQFIIMDQDTEYTEYLTGFSLQNEPNTCYFNGLYERVGNYHIQVRLKGYEPVEIFDADVKSGPCHVSTYSRSIELTPAINNCHDGYEWVNDQCQTFNDCAFPTFEQPHLSGIEGGETSYECVDQCKDPTRLTPASRPAAVLPSSPGVCQALALPSSPS